MPDASIARKKMKLNMSILKEKKLKIKKHQQINTLNIL